MYKITCDYCFEEQTFKTLNDQPEFCSNCNTQISHITPVEVTDAPDTDDVEKTGIPNGFNLTYEKTGQTIEIKHNEIIILGRQNTAKELLENIPQVSREHCKIEFFDGRYLVTDLNSLNGTFLGLSKRDCLKHTKQELNDGDLLFLGREPFKVQFSYSDSRSSQDLNAAAEENELPAVKFKCKACGKIHDMNLMICDNCGSYGQIELLED
jgi:hypothetical protein